MTELELLRSEVDKCHKIIESNLEMSKTLMANRHELQRQIEDQQRQWVDLTGEECIALVLENKREPMKLLVRVEAKLREKNA